MASWPESKALSETNISDLEDRITAANVEVVNGKQGIFDAIVAKHITPLGQTFAQLITAIGQIVLGSGTALAQYVLEPYTFTNNDGVEYTGTMPNRAGDTAAIASSVSGTTLKLRASTGFRDGVDDNVTITDADFLASNIKIGVDLLGLVGTLSNVKSIQRGTLSGVLDDSNNVSITSVDVSKSVVISVPRGDMSNAQYRFLNCRASITSSTNINFAFDASPGSSGPTVDWIVIEFDNVKSKQTGTNTIAANTNVTITSVDMSKSLVFVSFSNPSSSTADARGTMINGVLTSATNLLLLNPSTYVTVTNSINWQIIEFN